MARNRNVARHEFDYRIIVGRSVRLFLTEHPDAGEDEKCAEEIDDPVEALDESSAQQDHHDAHGERAEHAPVENAVLKFRRDFEEGEDEQEDEEIINRERQLDEIACDKLRPFLFAQMPEDRSGKEHRHSDPDRTPDEGFPILEGVRLAMKQSQIETEHGQDQRTETHPQPDRM